LALFFVTAPGQVFGRLLGIIILLTGIRMFLGLPFWLPEWLASRSLSSESVMKLFSVARPLAKTFSRWVKPRGRVFSNHPGFKRFSYFLICCVGVIFTVFGISPLLALPVVALSLGVFEEDSVYLYFGLWFFLMFSLIVIGRFLILVFVNIYLH
jgi:hypothetical protein